VESVCLSFVVCIPGHACQLHSWGFPADMRCRTCTCLIALAHLTSCVKQIASLILHVRHCRTSSLMAFSWGLENRAASVSIPRAVLLERRGGYEDRRPAANMDPYLASMMLVATTGGLPLPSADQVGCEALRNLEVKAKVEAQLLACRRRCGEVVAGCGMSKHNRRTAAWSTHPSMRFCATPAGRPPGGVGIRGAVLGHPG